MKKMIFIVCPPSVVSEFQKEFRKRIGRNEINKMAKKGIVWNIPKKCHHKDEGMGYLEHMVWLEKMSKRYKQERCPKCGLFAVWKKK